MESQEWLRTQLTTVRCSGCGEAYPRSRIRILAQRDELWFVSLRCAGCGASALGLVTVRVADEADAPGPGEAPVVGEAGPAAHRMSAEFTAADAARLAGSPAIGADDVIEAHRFLAVFDGDFRRLFDGGEGG
jgi:hypothetical protein